MVVLSHTDDYNVIHCEHAGLVELLCAVMPEFFVALRTGHELTSLSALYEYLGASVVLTLPAGLVLAGWTPMPWGQTGYGSTPATLECLIKCGVGMEDLDRVINKLFHLSE